MNNKNDNFEHMKQIILTAFAACLFLAAAPASGQETWSLERCIVYAQDANLNVKQARANVNLALLTEKQAKANRLPNVSAGVSAGEQFGRTIDPTTNQFNTTGIGYNRLSVDANVPLFNGGQIHHSVKQSGWDAKAAQADAEQSANTLALQVAQAYLNILLSEEQVESARRRVEQSQRQLNVTQKLIDAGTIPAADRFNILAQISRDEQTAVAAQNNVDLAYLSLKQLLQLEPDFDLKIEHPVFEMPAGVNPEGYSLQPVYATALGTQPNVKAAEFRIKSAEEGVSLAKSAYYPSLSLYGSLSSSYSTEYFNYIGTGESVKGDPVTIDFNGTTQVIAIYQERTRRERIPYTDQLDQNFGQGIGVQLRVPIYQNGSTRLSVERARLGVINAQLQQNQVQQQLKNDIQTAIANARSARKQLDAAQKTFEFMESAFNNTEKRHTLGAVNALELTLAKTNLDNSENDLLVAKYDYLFKLKILDFYQGKAISLK